MNKISKNSKGNYDANFDERMSLGEVPSDDYPVSYNPDGTVLSVFGDTKWDLTPYSYFGEAAFLYFPYWDAENDNPKKALNAETRWLLQLIIEDRKPKSLTVGTLQNNVTGLISLAKHALNSKISLVRLLSDWTHMREYIAGDPGGKRCMFLPH